MSYKPERALTRANPTLVVTLICSRNELQAREGIDTNHIDFLRIISYMQ